jgi:hypothetical protein
VIESFVGAVVGHLVAEYVIQPEWMLSQKRVFAAGALTASLGHSVVWTACVWGCSPGLPYEALAALCVVHHALDCTPLGMKLPQWLGTQSMVRSMQMSIDEEMPQLVAAVQFALAAASETMFNFALHVGAIYAVLRLTL